MKKIMIMLAAISTLALPAIAGAISAPVPVTGNGAFTLATSSGFTLNYTQPTDPAHTLLLCSVFSSTATSTHIYDSDGGFVQLTNLYTPLNWNYQYWYGRMGVSGTTTNITFYTDSTNTTSAACGIFTGVNALPTRVATKNGLTTTTLAASSTFTAYSLPATGFYRQNGTLTAATDTAPIATVASSNQGIYYYGLDTSAGGVYTMNITSTLSGSLYGSVMELLAVPDATTTPDVPIGGATSTIEQSQQNMILSAFIFLFAMFGMIWLMRSQK